MPKYDKIGRIASYGDISGSREAADERACCAIEKGYPFSVVKQGRDHEGEAKLAIQAFNRMHRVQPPRKRRW